jgi:hypothetical protein
LITKKHCRLPFGAYVETHEENKPSNTLKERTRAAICLGPTANFQGSYKFLCLHTGRRITRKQFRELPMSSSVIEAMEALADHDKQEGTLEFTDRDVNAYDDLYDTNQPTDGVAGVDIVDELTQDEQEHEEETINEDVEFPTAELDTEITGVAPLENPRIENPEIPGVEPNPEIPGVGTAETPGVGTEETPGVHNEEIEPDDTDMNLEAPEMEEAPEESITVPPPIQSG